MPFVMEPVSKFEEPELWSRLWSLGPLPPRCAPQPFLVAALVLPSAGPAFAASWGGGFVALKRAGSALALLAVLLWRWCSSLQWRLSPAVMCWCPVASPAPSGVLRLSPEKPCRSFKAMPSGTRLLRSSACPSLRSWAMTCLESFLMVEKLERKLIFWTSSRRGAQQSLACHQFWEETPPTFYQQAFWKIELLILICFVCNLAVLVANLQIQAKVPVVGAKTYQVSGDDRKGREEGQERFLEGEEEERRRKVPKDGCTGGSIPIFVEGAGQTCIININPDVKLEELELLVETEKNLPKGSFFLTLSGKVLDDARVSGLARDVSVRVNFRLRGGMMRVPRDAPGQWSCEYCGMNHCWPTRSTCYRCGEEGGTRKKGANTFGTWRVKRDMVVRRMEPLQQQLLRVPRH